MTPKDIIIRAESITTVTVDTVGEAIDLLSSLNRIKDNITQEREKVTRPLLDALNAERAKWKPKELRLESVITKIRSALTKYQTEKVNAERLAQEAIAKKLQDGKIKPETAIKRMQAVETVDNKIESTAGSVTFKTVTTFTVSDWKQVPEEFLLLNETKVRELLKNGTKIAGLEYKNEQIPVNYR